MEPVPRASAWKLAGGADEGGGLRLQIQILSSDGYPQWPSEIREIEQRYSEAPPARLRTYTAAGFAAAKLDAWISRRAARDLFDMWAMAHQGMITSAALDLFTRHGQLTSPPGRWVFERLPTAAEWDDQLAHQTSVTVSPAEAARVVAQAWDTARLGASPPGLKPTGDLSGPP